VEARLSQHSSVAAAAAVAAIAVVDAALGAKAILTTALVLPVLALALAGRSRDVLRLAAGVLVLAFVSGFWNDYFASTDHAIRFVIVSVGALLAVLSARSREASERARARMVLLAEAGRVSDAATVEGALERLGELTVPAAADRVRVELLDEEGQRDVALDHGEAAGGERVTLPLRIRERTIGVLDFERRAYDAEDRAFLEALAGRVALALGNIRLLDELRQTRERLDRILGSLAEAVTVHDAEGQTIYANEAACELLGVRVPAGEPARAGSLARRFIITHEDGTPVSVEEFPGRRLMAGEPDPPPLLTRSVRRDTGREYWLLTKATLLHDADGAPLAVNVIEDVTDAKEAELRQRFLDEAGQVLASSLDYEQALQRVSELAVPWLADWCAVDLAVEGGIQRVVVAHADPEKLAFADELTRRYPPDPAAETGVPAVLRSGEGELYPDIPDELLAQAARDEEHLRLMRAIGMRAAMAVPMTAGGEVLGAMTFVSAESARSFDEDDFAFAQDLARRAAVAVQNGRRYAEQVRVAETLQRSLLPDRLPVVPGWEAGASYAAGDERAEVGGDFYDVVPTSDGHLVFLGDVTGKGVEAAALTALVRHAAQTAARFERQPSALLAVINALLREQPRLSPVSVVCALIEPREGRPSVTVASAGHPLPLLRRSGEPLRELGRHDVLLGVVAQEEFAEETLEVEPGDVLLFYTDGVIDAPGAAGRFGEERLLAAIAGGPAEPGALLEAIDRELRRFTTEGSGADDRAMLALRYTGSPAPAGEAHGSPLAGARG
jgi:PAS domain S-box-containing protein